MAEVFRFKLAGSQKLAENGIPRLNNLDSLEVGDGIFVQGPNNPGPLLVYSDQGLEIGEVREPHNSKIIDYLNSGYEQLGYSTKIDNLSSGKKSVEIELTLLSIEEKEKSERLKRFDFVVLDVETANQSYASICQIGLAFVKAGEVVETWGTYVNPKENFTNTRIHGIDTSMVTGSPTFPSAWSQTLDLIDGFLVFHHTHFDRTALNQAVKKHGLKPPTIRFMDSANLARSANSKFAVRGYGLENLCSSYQIQYENAHNAVSDASMTAKVIHCLLQESSTKTSDWSELETDFFGNTARSNKRSRSRQDPYSERKTDLTYEVDLREILGSAPSIKEMAAKKENKGRDHNSQSTTKLEYGKIALIAFVILVADFVLFGALDNPSEGFQNVIIFILLVSIGVFIWSFRKWRKSRLLKK